MQIRDALCIANGEFPEHSWICNQFSQWKYYQAFMFMCNSQLPNTICIILDASCHGTGPNYISNMCLLNIEPIHNCGPFVHVSLEIMCWHFHICVQNFCSVMSQIGLTFFFSACCCFCGDCWRCCCCCLSG